MIFEVLPKLFELDRPQDLQVGAESVEIILAILVDESYELQRLLSDLLVRVAQEVVRMLEDQLQIGVLHWQVLVLEGQVDDGEAEGEHRLILAFESFEDFWHKILLLFEH